MEGNTLMKSEMRRFILDQLRIGTSPQSICDMLRGLIDELDNASVYIKAIKEADFAP
jgi:hypothetical protein